MFDMDLEALGDRLDPSKRYVFVKKPIKRGLNGRPKLYAPRKQPSFMKPSGLWYAPGDAWLRWVLREMPEWALLWCCLYEIEVNDSVLTIRTQEALEAFSEQYLDRSKPFGLDIDWQRFIKDTGAAGVEIMSSDGDVLSHWTEDHGVIRWYSSWDIPSGCVWNARGIRSLTPIATWRPSS